jgi:hypothetical protein
LLLTTRTKDRRFRTDVLFIRAESAIRADGCRPRKLERDRPTIRSASVELTIHHCALRAPTALFARIRSIRAKNAVIDKSKS